MQWAGGLLYSSRCEEETGDVRGDVAEPGPVLEPLKEAARRTHRAVMPLQARQQGHERVGEAVDRVARIALEDTEIDDEMNGWRIGPDIGTPIDCLLYTSRCV